MIELSRNITFGQFVNNGSSLTRMDPRIKLMSAILLIALVSYVGTYAAFAVCLFGCLAVQWASQLPGSYIWRTFRPIVILLLFIFVFQVLLYSSPTQYTTLIWHWGIFSISQEGILHSASAIVRALFLYYLTALLLFTTSLVDLTDGMEALLSPLQRLGLPVNAFIMVLVIAFKFVPILVGEVERLTKAQAARGVRFDSGNFIRRAMKIGPLLIPLFLSGLRRSELLAMAMEARCYSGGRRGWRRSKRRQLHIERFDVLALIFVIAFCAVAVVVNIFAPF
ncbi:MAG TPA: energy-coupling factor transporter transmembrane component T [Ktedonobacteraceae bacterium]|nr:energy-coupling factor transporter transmembrane component T [Ktedonobacteraceae bacterium]